MKVIKSKNELYDFTEKLYDNLKDIVIQCTDLKEVIEVLDGEYVNITDYKKALKNRTVNIVKEHAIDDRVIVKKIEQINKAAVDVDILPIETDEDKVYLKEDSNLVIDSETTNEDKSKKIKIVVMTILAGAAIGGAVKRDIYDAIIAGLLGALAGFAIYEVNVAGENNNFEKVIKKDKIINKRLDIEYLNILINERKNQVEKLFLNYIEKLNNIADNE